MRKFLKPLVSSLFSIIARPYNKYLHKSYTFKGSLRARIYTHLFSQCGENLIINGKPIIFEPEKISVGKNVTINNGAQLSPRGKIILSDYVTMSRGAQIIAGELDMNCWVNEAYKKHIHTQGDVFLGEGTWLCANSIVLPGVKITGKGVVVAAGAVVTKSFHDDYVVLGGVPAKIVKHLNTLDNDIVR